MPLFRVGSFTLHSGGASFFKIDCDALTDDDLTALAELASPVLQPYGQVVGIPSGGMRFAEALSKFSTVGSRLLVDDVLTTGASMLAEYLPGDKGVVIFARTPTFPNWVRAVFTLTI